jgi:hypothetical protein
LRESRRRWLIAGGAAASLRLQLANYLCARHLKLDEDQRSHDAAERLNQPDRQDKLAGRVPLRRVLS